MTEKEQGCKRLQRHSPSWKEWLRLKPGQMHLPLCSGVLIRSFHLQLVLKSNVVALPNAMKIANCVFVPRHFWGMWRVCLIFQERGVITSLCKPMHCSHWQHKHLGSLFPTSPQKPCNMGSKASSQWMKYFWRQGGRILPVCTMVAKAGAADAGSGASVAAEVWVGVVLGEVRDKMEKRLGGPSGALLSCVGRLRALALHESYDGPWRKMGPGHPVCLRQPWCPHSFLPLP